jgi:hypothetical protein
MLKSNERAGGHGGGFGRGDVGGFGGGFEALAVAVSEFMAPPARSVAARAQRLASS